MESSINPEASWHDAYESQMSATGGEFAGLNGRDVARRCSRSKLKSAEE